MNRVNPWLSMGNNVERKIENTNTKQIFWITDLSGNFGISFRVNSSLKINKPQKFREIIIQKRNTRNGSELNIILTNKNEWELFFTLCNSLVSAAMNFDSEEASIKAVENRLKRWQELFKNAHLNSFSLEKQMGIFVELKCLQEIIAPSEGYNQAITSWVGIDYDKQDFLLDNLAIEVKSHKTSKGNIVRISSKYQLDSIKNKVVLISYSLTFSELGEDVNDMVNRIRSELANEDASTRDLFETKLIEYGFIPEIIETSLQKFCVDSDDAYLVNQDFPRIESQKVSPLVQKVNYSIDLTYCDRFLIPKDQIF